MTRLIANLVNAAYDLSDHGQVSPATSAWGLQRRAGSMEYLLLYGLQGTVQATWIQESSHCYLKKHAP